MENRLEYTDIVVVGSGMAGITAAWQAADAGANVVLLEKMAYTGGNSALAGGGYACWDSSLKLRERLGLGDDSWELHMEDTIAAGKNQSVPELVETMAKGAPDGMDWLLDKGVEFKEILVKLGGYRAHRAHQAATSGKKIMDILNGAAAEKGVDIRCGCQVCRILQDMDDGRIFGVNYICDGKSYRLLAGRGVIIASGGFARDVKMRMQYCPELAEDMNCSNHRGATGEMIINAQNVGADTLHMNFIQLYPCANPVSGSVDRWAFYCYSGAGFGMLYVNSAGQRFISETAGRDELSRRQIDTCENPTWAVFNAEIADALGMTETEIKNGLRFGRMACGESLEELAKAMGAEADVMENTVKAHNAFLRGEISDEFGKDFSKSFIPLDKGPYYAISQWPSVHYTMGGLRIDTSARVLNKEGKPIPGLYAAGEVCGGVHGANRMGGNALAECVVFGRIAGASAAACK